MERAGFGLDDGSHSGDQRQALSLESRLSLIELFIECLVHACQCREENCRLRGCHKMKRLFQHIKSCKQRTNLGCLQCSKLIALICFHAKRCQEAECHVPCCAIIKNKLRQHPLQELILRRHIAVMRQVPPGA